MSARVQSVFTIVCAVALVAFWIFGLPWLAYLSVMAGAVFALQTAFESIKARELDVNVLMVVAAVGAVVLGHPGEAAVLLFLFSLSNTLEAYTLGKTKSAIEGLIALRPEKAILVKDGVEQVVDIKQLRVGDLVRVKPFEQIPLDGVLKEGQTHVNQVAMTGESVPVARSVGEEVLAGTQNEEGMFLMEVLRVTGETTLDKVVELVQDAQENKATGERISQWFGQTYTFFVIGAFAISLIIRLVIGQDWNAAAYASLTLLVALSPCALVISVPASTLSALAWSARQGILIRGGQYVEELGKIDTVTMDKTGTLTVGKPVLREICVCTEELVANRVCRDDEYCWIEGESLSSKAAEFLGFAASAEQYSDHPIAAAIVKSARDHGLEVLPIASNEVVPGLGIRGELNGVKIQIGQPKFFENLPRGFQEHAEELRRKGMTVAIGEFNGEYAAFGLQDSPREATTGTLKDLQNLNVSNQMMLTGDSLATAEAIAKEVGLNDYRAGLSPVDKEEIIAGLVQDGKRVMMVGDGINDAPALSRAHVGVAMGGLGSDIALNSADIVLMNDKIEQLPRLIKMGRKATRIISANLIFAGGVMGVLSLGSVLLDVFVPEAHNLLLPLAVLGHEGSTVLVILNGLRLLRGPDLL